MKQPEAVQIGQKEGGTQQDVGWVDVTMQDAGSMQMVQGRSQLQC